MNSEDFIVIGTKIIVVLTFLISSFAIYLIIRDNRRKPILERKKRIQEQRNMNYFNQCLNHLKNGDIGIFEGVFGLITNKDLQNNLNFIYLGFKLNNPKKSEQNKTIKIIESIINDE